MARATRSSRRSSYYGGYGGGFDGGYPPYVPVGVRKKEAAAAAAAMRKKGHSVSPVEIQGRKIATTFWGKAWCENLERYSDFSNRLPRGRSYVRNGSVVDLQITRGQVTALVQGTRLYKVSIDVGPVAAAPWKAIVNECSGKIDSVVELLSGKLSGGVMAIITREKTGLFPVPAQITMKCSCPDWATMCKHVAAVLYGIGARFDHRPELLFELRGANPADLIAEVAAGGLSRAGKPRAKEKVLAGASLSSVFGIDIEGEADEPPAPVPPAKPAPRGKKAATAVHAPPAPVVPVKPAARGKKVATAVQAAAAPPAAAKRGVGRPRKASSA